VKSTGPGVFFFIFAFEIYFYSLLFSDLLNQKPKSTLLQFIFNLPISIAGTVLILQSYRQGIDNLLCALGARICCLCAGAASWVLGDSPSGSITLVS
jgi:hypothetical protein